MTRFALFVDGSNLYGAIKAMNIDVKDYEKFYKYIYKESVELWRSVTLQEPLDSVQLRRVYWYTVGTIDQWDLSLQKSKDSLRSAFSKDRGIHSFWLENIGRASSSLNPAELEEKAWLACFDDFKLWYEEQKRILEGMKGFYSMIRASTDLIDIIEKGHWKVNFLHKSVEEKGLDTTLAVDMLAFQENFDVGMIVSGDADAIPSIKHLKERNKYIAAVEFVNGSPPETKGRTFSLRLKAHADFVLRIYETDLVKLKLEQRPIL